MMKRNGEESKGWSQDEFIESIVAELNMLFPEDAGDAFKYAVIYLSASDFYQRYVIEHGRPAPESRSVWMSDYIFYKTRGMGPQNESEETVLAEIDRSVTCMKSAQRAQVRKNMMENLLAGIMDEETDTQDTQKPRRRNKK